MLPRPPAEVPPNMILCPGLAPTSWLTAARASLRPRYCGHETEEVRRRSPATHLDGAQAPRHLLGVSHVGIAAAGHIVMLLCRYGIRHTQSQLANNFRNFVINQRFVKLHLQTWSLDRFFRLLLTWQQIYSA